MAGTLDWVERKVECPGCGKEIISDFCVDYDPNETPSTVEGIAGGRIR